MNKLTGLLAILIGLTVQARVDALDNVRVTTNPEVVRGCKFLGNVSSREKGALDLIEKLKRKTSALDGNVLSIGPLVMTDGDKVTGFGEAYRCPDPAAAR
jgi:hypothetical protein